MYPSYLPCVYRTSETKRTSSQRPEQLWCPFYLQCPFDFCSPHLHTTIDMSLTNIWYKSIYFLRTKCPVEKAAHIELRVMSHKNHQTTARVSLPIYPRRRGNSLFSRMSLASVPWSIKSNFVITPIVLLPTKVTQRSTRGYGRWTSNASAVALI